MKSTRIALALTLSISALAVGCTAEAGGDEAGETQGAQTGVVADTGMAIPIGNGLELRACTAPPITADDHPANAMDNGKCRAGQQLEFLATEGLIYQLPDNTPETIYFSVRVDDDHWPSYADNGSGTAQMPWQNDKLTFIQAITADDSNPAAATFSFHPHRDGTHNTLPFWPTMYAEYHVPAGQDPSTLVAFNVYSGAHDPVTPDGKAYEAKRNICSVSSAGGDKGKLIIDVDKDTCDKSEPLCQLANDPAASVVNAPIAYPCRNPAITLTHVPFAIQGPQG